MSRAVVAVLVLAACGDGDEVCAPQPGELPTAGTFSDPADLPLPEGCIEGGLRDLPGRWFVSDPGQYFGFEYPLYAGSCSTGFRRAGLRPDDHDATDMNESTFHTWSDGTKYFQRSRSVFGGMEYVRASVTCMLPDDTIVTAYASASPDRDPFVYIAKGKRFAPKEKAIASGIELVGELGSKTGADIYGLNLIVDGNYAYIVGFLGFDVVDVTDPTAPVHVGHVDGRLNDVRIVKGGGKTVAFAASEGGDDRVWIIDVTEPANPQLVSLIDEYAHSLQLQTVGATTYLYLANYTNTVPRYDVTNPLTPVMAGIARVPEQPMGGIHDLTVYGDLLYVNATTSGMIGMDASGSYATPTKTGAIESAYSHASWAANIGGREIVLHGDEGMTIGDGGAYMRVLDGDRSSPTYMQQIGEYRSRREVGIHNIEVHGTRAYIAYYQDGVRVVDLGDPTKPTEVAHYNTWDPETSFGAAFEGAVGLRKVGDLLYVADDLRGLIILREL